MKSQVRSNSPCFGVLVSLSLLLFFFFASRFSTLAGMDFRKDPHVYRILRDYSDLMTIAFQTPEPLVMHRHKSAKKVYLVATKYFLYLIKKKGMKLYTRWPVRTLSVETYGSLLFISSGISAKESVAEYKSRAGKTRTSSRRANDSDDEDGDDDDDEENNEDSSTLISCHLEVDESTTRLHTLESDLRKLIFQAETLHKHHEREEAGIIRVRKVKVRTDEDDMAEDLGLNDDEQDEEDDDENGDDLDGEDEAEDEAAKRRKLRNRGRFDDALTGGAGAAARKKAVPSNAAAASSRFMAISSLVDGEFADYSALKNAYIHHEDGSLLEDLTVFVSDNEAQVQQLCRDHYVRFLNAARQCRSLSDEDAGVVKEELSGANILVRKSALEMKQAATALFLSSAAKEKIELTQVLTTRMRLVAEAVEAAEAQAQNQQLVAAVKSCDRAAHLATPLAGFVIGEYVLHHRIPQLRQTIFTAAQSNANGWMRYLREQTAVIGNVALQNHRGTAQNLGRFQRRIVIAEGGDEWWVDEQFVGSSVTIAGGDTGTFASIVPVINNVCSGSFIQRVFLAANKEIEFAQHYNISRHQQHANDLFSTAPIGSSEALQQYCALAVGVMVVEDIVHHVTRPHVTSKAELLALWDRISTRIAREAETVAITLCMTNAVEEAKGVFRLLAQVVNVIVDAIRTVELSPLLLTRVLERSANQLHSLWLQQVCLDVEQIISTDSLTPVAVKDASEYQANVARFLLNKCPSMKLPIPGVAKGGSTVYLPFALFVPMVGDRVLGFVEKCLNIVTSANGRQSEVNNTDAMIVEYVSVVFRKANGMISSVVENKVPPQAVLQFAVLSTSCTALQVVLSAVEQAYVLQWEGDATAKQTIGKPMLFASCAALFSQTSTACVAKMHDGVQAKLMDLLKPIGSISYWRARVDLRKKQQQAQSSGGAEGAAPADENALKAAVDYLCKTMQSLTQLLQPDIVQTISRISLLHLNQESYDKVSSAILQAMTSERDCALLRSCLQEAESSLGLAIADCCRRLDAIVGNIAHKVAPSDVIASVRHMIEKKELEQAEESRLESASQAVVGVVGGGVMATRRGLATVGNAVFSTVVDAKSAVVGLVKPTGGGAAQSSGSVTPRAAK